jgi:hypothetical protein
LRAAPLGPRKKPSPIFSTRWRLFALAVGAISYGGSILFNVRQWTFVRQYLA